MITVERMAVVSVGTSYLVMPIRVAFMHDITSDCFLVYLYGLYLLYCMVFLSFIISIFGCMSNHSV